MAVLAKNRWYSSPSFRYVLHFVFVLYRRRFPMCEWYCYRTDFVQKHRFVFEVAGSIRCSAENRRERKFEKLPISLKLTTEIFRFVFCNL